MLNICKSVHLSIVQQFISKSFARPRPEFLKWMHEILGLLLLTQWVKNLAKRVLVGRRLVAGRGALPVHLKSSVKPGACQWECQKYQARVRNLAQGTETFWAANLFVTTSESIARPEDLFHLSSNQCWLRLLGRANPSWQVLCAIKLQGVPKKFLIELSFAVALQYLVH